MIYECNFIDMDGSMGYELRFYGVSNVEYMIRYRMLKVKATLEDWVQDTNSLMVF